MGNLILVEDDLTILAGMAAVLMSVGHQVRALSKPERVLQEVETDPPELIISDVSMPGMTGPQLLDAVRARSQFKHIPFLFVSAGTTPDVEEYIASLSRVQFLGKPFEIDGLQAAVSSALNLQPAQVGVG